MQTVRNLLSLNNGRFYKNGGKKAQPSSESAGEPPNPRNAKTKSAMQVNICCETTVTPQGK